MNDKNVVSTKSVFLGLMAGVFLALFIGTAEAKSKKSKNLRLLQGTWVGYGKVKGQRSKCRVRIRHRAVSALCGNASGSVRSTGRVRGASKMWSQWSSSDGLYTGTSRFSSIGSKSHRMNIYVDGHGSGTLHMKKR